MPSYTEEQLTIINSKMHDILVIASAGTGKTHTLIAAATKIMYEEPDSKVAVFTLTKAAAEELKERFEVLPSFVGTIHSFALTELKKMEEDNLLISEIMSNDKMKRLLLNSYTHFYDIRRNFKEEINDIYKYMVDRNYVPTVQTASRYDKVVSHYTKRKKELELYDFTDAPEYYFKQAQKKKYQTEYTHLFVDEVQDIDLWEYEIIRSFKGRVFAIGDPKQNIYQFRNSISHIFDKLEKMGYNLYILSENFRSFQEILDYADAQLDAGRGYGGIITDMEMLEQDDVVVLCRYNHQVRQLSPYFDEVRTVHSYKGLESDNVFVVDFSTHDEENENVMFVAKTRARNVLGIDTFDNTIRKGREIKYGL